MLRCSYMPVYTKDYEPLFNPAGRSCWLADSFLGEDTSSENEYGFRFLSKHPTGKFSTCSGLKIIPRHTEKAAFSQYGSPVDNADSGIPPDALIDAL